jgi:hypothetical protein
MAMFNLFDYLAMTKVEARVGLLKGQLIFIIKYLVSSFSTSLKINEKRKMRSFFCQAYFVAFAKVVKMA